MFTRRLELAAVGAFAFTGFASALLYGRGQRDDALLPPRRPESGIPNVPLKTHTGKSVRFYDDLVRGKLVLVTMMYAACNNTCPPSTFNLVQVQRMLGKRVGKDIFMYSLTLQPEHDSPDDLAHYAKIHNVGPGWLFLTGEPTDVHRLRYALGFYDPDSEVDRQNGRHVGMVRIGNDPYRRWGMAPTLAAPEQIVSMILHMDLKPRSLIG